MKINNYQEKEVDQKQLSIRLDPQLKQRFLHKVRRQGTDATKVLVACIEGYLADDPHSKSYADMVILMGSMERRITELERTILEIVTE